MRCACLRRCRPCHERDAWLQNTSHFSWIMKCMSAADGAGRCSEGKNRCKYVIYSSSEHRTRLSGEVGRKKTCDICVLWRSQTMLTSLWRFKYIATALKSGYSTFILLHIHDSTYVVHIMILILHVQPIILCKSYKIFEKKCKRKFVQKKHVNSWGKYLKIMRKRKWG